MSTLNKNIQLNKLNTGYILETIKTIIKDNEVYEASKIITRDFLGTHKLSHDEYLFGFWLPGLSDGYTSNFKNSIYLEILSPKTRSLSSLNFDVEEEQSFTKTRLPLVAINDYLIGVVNGIFPGNNDELGDLFWLNVNLGFREFNLQDPLASSLPFGVYLPAELFDIEEMLLNRKDLTYFSTHYKKQFHNGVYLGKDIGSCLELHTETASKEGTIKALTSRFQSMNHVIKDNIARGKSNIYEGLNTEDLNSLSFDTIRLLPDILIFETLRPNEMLFFIETLHNMSDKPIQVCIGSVLGYCDLQGAFLLETYGELVNDVKNINFANHNIKAMLIELLRRKINLGYDSIRIDGIQDFIKDRDRSTVFSVQDDDFFRELVNITQEIPIANSFKILRRDIDIKLEGRHPWPNDLNLMHKSPFLGKTIESEVSIFSII